MSKRNKILLIIFAISIIISAIGMILVLKNHKEVWPSALLIFTYFISIPATTCYCYDKIVKCIEGSSSDLQACRRGFYLGFYWDFLFWLTLLIAPIGAILYIRYCHNNYLDKKRKEEITSNFS